MDGRGQAAALAWPRARGSIRSAGAWRISLALTLVALTAACLLAYVAQSARLTDASYRLAELQAQHDQLLAEQQQLRASYSTVTAPDRIGAAAAKLGLQLQPMGQTTYIAAAHGPQLTMAAPGGGLALGGRSAAASGSLGGLVAKLGSLLSLTHVAQAAGRQ